jgi:hypothetical protein
MEKLKLSLEDLVVETFAPATQPGGLGTVRARQSGPVTDECDSCGVDTGCGRGGCDSQDCPTVAGCGTNTCPGWETCPGAYTCDGVESCRWPQCSAYGNIC